MALPDKRLAATEIGVVLAFYQWYSAARHWVAGSEAAAHRNAMRLIDLESSLGLFNEARFQQWALSIPWAVRLLSLHYMIFHFAVTVLALVILFRRSPERYRLYRNALGWMSVLGVVTFALWPLMPPRLLSGSYGFVDVFATKFRPPSIDRGFAPALYNGFAAMPSLHVAYALWCVAALVPVLASRWARIAVISHAAATMVAVVATGNHFWLDAVGGALAVVGGVALSRRIQLPQLLPTPAIAVAGLLGAALFIWVPKGEAALAVEDVVVAGALVAAIAVRRRPGGRARRAPAVVVAAAETPGDEDPPIPVGSPFRRW
ncbi:MAG: phosphatase PAP2 family protein [Acidimicrobiia bacterium]